MKIRSIAVNQFKKFTTPMRLADICDGLNIVVGPNEMGKSTLLDALRAALFERYSSRAQPIRALQNDRNKAAPVVELEFEIDEEVYRVGKRFLKNAYAHLCCPDGRKLEGDEAEDNLRRLLGFDRPGNVGATPETLGMWNVLWVQQGQSFGALELPDSARSNLHSALESEVGEVLGGRRGQGLIDTVRKQLSGFLTSNGNPRGSYKQRIEEVGERRSELETLQGRRSDLSQTLDQLEAAQEKLARLSLGAQDQEDKEALDRARRRLSELAKLESSIEAATTDVELKKRKLEQAEAAIAERGALRDQIKSEEAAVQAAKKKLDEVRQAEQELKKQVESLRNDSKQAEEVVAEGDKAVSMARRVLTAVQRRDRIRGFQERYKKAQVAEAKQRDAQQGAMAIFVTNERIEHIRDAMRQLEMSRSRLAAAATIIAFDMPYDRLNRIEVNGVALGAGQPSMEAVEETTISIPDYGSISIQPAIKDRDRLIAQQRDAENVLKAALEECSVKSVEDAEAQFARREELIREAEFARQEAELHAPETDEYAAGAEPLFDYITRLKAILEREMADLEIENLPSETDAEQAVEAAEGSAQQARDTQIAARAALAGPEGEMSRVQNELGSVQERYDESHKRLDKLKINLTEAEKQVSDKDLEAVVATARKALADQERAVSELERQRKDETLEQLDARIARLETALQKRRDKRSGLKEKVVRLQSHVEALEGAGLDELIQKKEREVEMARDQLQRHEREVAVLTLLLSTLQSAETDAKERYLSPVLQRVRRYLKCLFPNAEIAIDENFHIVDVIRENGHKESFEHLSMGTQEQIAVLVRLAFAEMLVEKGHPAAVVLDDALVFSDDHRMERMFDILNMVGKNVQVIVLTCREQLFEGIGGKHLELQPINTDELPSA